LHRHDFVKDLREEQFVELCWNVMKFVKENGFMAVCLIVHDRHVGRVLVVKMDDTFSLTHNVK